MSYLNPAEYTVLSLLPSEWLEEEESRTPGWIQAQLGSISRLDVDARLRKRYAVPFENPAPEAVKGWVARLMDMRVLLHRGVDPQDQQFAQYEAYANTARDEIKEAANGQDGLFDLPLRADTSASGITKGGPFSYSERSPYVWTSRQGRTGRREDAQGRGTFR